MGALIRAFIGAIFSMIIANFVQGLFRPRVKDENADKRPAMDMKQCPRCGVYSSHPCDNPDCSFR